MGTIVEIIVADQNSSGQFLNGAIKAAFEEIARVEDLLSRFKPQSDISRINAGAAVQPVTVSRETIALIAESAKFSRLSNGAFDITVQPLMQIWGFAENGRERLPSPEELKQARSKVGYQHIKIIDSRQSVSFAQPGMSLDLGGLAKGYAVDQAVAALKKRGIKNALINAGGDIYALGSRGKLKKWRIAVRHPRKKAAVLAVLELQDQAVATSGDYEQYIKAGGRRLSHIVNPGTGQPCADSPASVTVLAEDCLTADALATAVCVLGSKKGMDLINRLENSEAIIVNIKKDKADILLSQGLQERSGLIDE